MQLSDIPLLNPLRNYRYRSSKVKEKKARPLKSALERKKEARMSSMNIKFWLVNGGMSIAVGVVLGKVLAQYPLVMLLGFDQWL